MQRDGSVARLTLNRPAVGNAIDMSMAKALLDASILCDEDDAIRCVLLSGAGRCFCVGGDVTCFAAAGDGVPAYLRELTQFLHQAIARLAHMSKPLITAVNGPAAGAGCSLAILGDLVLAAKSAHFTLAYTALGLTPDGGVTWMLPRLVGLRRAQELVMTNRRVTSDEASRLNLVTRIIEDSALPTESQNLSRDLSASATRALGRARNLIMSSFSTSFPAQMEAEANAMADSSCTPEGREGIAAFIAKRRPDFNL
jgi:2-(1,2-epoxy-1,2-dihydrophenyl)acetyl-CoA isomerase